MDASIAYDGNSVSLRNLEKRELLTQTGHLRGQLSTDNSQKSSNVPIENEESKPKNNSQSYYSNFIRSEIKLIRSKILLTKCNLIINRRNYKSEINARES